MIDSIDNMTAISTCESEVRGRDYVRQLQYSTGRQHAHVELGLWGASTSRTDRAK